MVWRGAFDSGHTYAVNDIVQHDGYCWVATAPSGQDWQREAHGGSHFNNASGGVSFVYPGGTPTPGDLLILALSSDTTVATPSGWSVAVADVGNLGAYLLYRVAQAGESDHVVVTTDGDYATSVWFERWSGGATTGVLDVTAHAGSLSGGLHQHPRSLDRSAELAG